MVDKLMYNPNDYTQYFPFCRLKLVIETNQNSIKVPEVVEPTNKQKRYYKTLGTSVIINSPMSSIYFYILFK